MKRWVLLTGLLACMAQALAEPQVRVETRLQPAAPYQVGSTLRLEIDLLTTTWFTQAPQPAQLELAGALVSPPNGQADKLTEKIDGTPYFGLRLTYLISPTQAGDFSIPALPFSLRLGQADAPLQVSTGTLQFSVSGAAHPAADGTALVSRQVRIEQQIEKSAAPLKVGDRLTRRIQIQAEDAQAMLIPPTEFADIPGLKRYPQPPEVSALSNGRGSTDGGLRIDSASYVVEEAGDYTLPAISLDWWDSSSQQARTSSVPAVEFAARAASGFALPFSLEADLEKLGRGRLIRVSRPAMLFIGALILLGVLGYLGRSRLHEEWTHLQSWRSRRRDNWLASEAYAWRELQQALRKNPLPLAELYRWQLRSQGCTDVQLLAAQLPPAAAASLQQALSSNYGSIDPAHINQEHVDSVGAGLPARLWRGLDRGQARSYSQCAALKVFDNSCRINSQLAQSTSPELGQGLQQLRQSLTRRARLQAQQFQLQPLRPWAAAAITDSASRHAQPIATEEQ